MKVRYCPCCAQLVHFEASTPIQRCWNCARLTDFTDLPSPDYPLYAWLPRGLNALTQRTVPLWLRIGGIGKPALIVAMPIAVLMLLICNSFDLRIVHDLTASFPFPIP